MPSATHGTSKEDSTTTDPAVAGAKVRSETRQLRSRSGGGSDGGGDSDGEGRCNDSGGGVGGHHDCGVAVVVGVMVAVWRCGGADFRWRARTEWVVELRYRICGELMPLHVARHDRHAPFRRSLRWHERAVELEDAPAKEAAVVAQLAAASIAATDTTAAAASATTAGTTAVELLAGEHARRGARGNGELPELGGADARRVRNGANGRERRLVHAGHLGALLHHCMVPATIRTTPPTATPVQHGAF